jgi:hypothetical protein
MRFQQRLELIHRQAARGHLLADGLEQLVFILQVVVDERGGAGQRG